MRNEFDSGVFGKEKDGGFLSAVAQIRQGFGDDDFYPTLEEKAAMLLYLVVKKPWPALPSSLRQQSGGNGNGKEAVDQCAEQESVKNSETKEPILKPSLTELIQLRNEVN